MRALIIGYGNPSRRDDGVGLAVINGLRRRLGKAPFDEGDDGYNELGGPVDTLFLQQLMPELAETLAGYDRVWFVDAHLGIYPGAGAAHCRSPRSSGWRRFRITLARKRFWPWPNSSTARRRPAN